MNHSATPRPGGSPFDPETLEEMYSKKTQGARSPKQKYKQQTNFVSQSIKKFDRKSQVNPWLKTAREEEAIAGEPSLKKEPVREETISAEVETGGRAADLAEQEREPSPPLQAREPESVLPGSPGTSAEPSPVSQAPESLEDERIAETESEKAKKASRFTDETIDEIVSQKTADKADDKKVKVEVVTLGAGIARAIGKGLDGVIETGKAVAGAAGSGAQAAVDIVQSGLKGTAETVKGAVKPAKTRAKDEAKPKGENIIAEAAKTASVVTEQVADGVLNLSSGIGKAAGYVAKGAVAAPVDIIRGISGVAAGAAISVSNLLVGSKKKSKK